jgi:hypothetical protein
MQHDRLNAERLDPRRRERGHAPTRSTRAGLMTISLPHLREAIVTALVRLGFTGRR